MAVLGDFPGTAEILGGLSPSAYHSCRWCTTAGSYSSHVYYPYRLSEVNGICRSNLRSNQDLPNALKAAKREGLGVANIDFSSLGLRSLSPLFSLSYLSFPDISSPDIMHCLCLNIPKTMFTYMVESDRAKEIGALYVALNTIHTMFASLMAVKSAVPRSFGRVPWSPLKPGASLRAEDWRNFAIYYSVPLLHSAGVADG